MAKNFIENKMFTLREAFDEKDEVRSSLNGKIFKVKIPKNSTHAFFWGLDDEILLETSSIEAIKITYDGLKFVTSNGTLYDLICMSALLPSEYMMSMEERYERLPEHIKKLVTFGPMTIGKPKHIDVEAWKKEYDNAKKEMCEAKEKFKKEHEEIKSVLSGLSIFEDKDFEKEEEIHKNLDEVKEMLSYLDLDYHYTEFCKDNIKILAKKWNMAESELIGAIINARDISDFVTSESHEYKDIYYCDGFSAWTYKFDMPVNEVEFLKFCVEKKGYKLQCDSSYYRDYSAIVKHNDTEFSYVWNRQYTD